MLETLFWMRSSENGPSKTSDLCSSELGLVSSEPGAFLLPSAGDLVAARKLGMVIREEYPGFQAHPLCSPHRSFVVHTIRLPAMRFLLLTSTCCLLAMALAAEVKKPAAPGTAEKLSPKAATLAERSAGLAFSLYQAMAKDQAVENILLSPVVVASSLGLVSLGGKATTASQAKAVLSAEQLRDEEVHAGLGELLRAFSNSTARNVTWKLGSRLYGPSSVSFAEDFVRSSKQHYNCEHSKINFRDKRSALQSINEWAAQTTDGKLPEVTKDVERTDGALLVNAMFFKRESGQGWWLQLCRGRPNA